MDIRTNDTQVRTPTNQNDVNTDPLRDTSHDDYMSPVPVNTPASTIRDRLTQPSDGAISSNKYYTREIQK